jgi:hypothetical protein
MSETSRSQPDEATIAWLRQGANVRLGGYSAWRREIVPSTSIANGMHDAWRSLGRDDERARKDFGDLERGDQMLCVLTGLDILESIYEHARLEPQPMGRTFGPAFVYRAMQNAFTRYYLYTKLMGAREEGYLFATGSDIIMAEDSEFFSYGQMPSKYKEVDRRMVMVGMMELAHPDNNLVEPATRRELLRNDNVERAILDGHAILQAARVGAPYDQEQGFAAEVIHWQV